ncbi:MAG TPA: M15 family metallopeptidase [Dongiaceae bacterium]|nr:M15 family metallopeptidase [Dongiaceae bacterium]
MNQKILTYEDIAPIKIGTSDEKLVDVRMFDGDITAVYEKFDMVTIAGSTILVRQALAKKLAAVNRRLKEQYGYRLKVVYGYRAPEVQEDYFQKRRVLLAEENPNLSDANLDKLTHNFVAIPEIAGHPAGGAIDITLIDDDGAECDMGTGIADYTNPERIRTFDPSITSEQRNNRLILLDAMTNEGFAPFFGEWWHFSYGDREWAAFYNKPSAIYGPITVTKQEPLLTSAGGNGTVVQITDKLLSNVERRQIGKSLLDQYELYGAEQVGFLCPSRLRFDMAGGEFCGNATCVAAVLLSQSLKQSQVTFAVSGLEGKVSAQVKKTSEISYDVTVSFNNLRYTTQREIWKGSPVDIVDFGGIVHVVISGLIPASEDQYKSELQQLIQQLGLQERDAVGAIWCQQKEGLVKIDPIVWVGAIATCFYESSCGSGSIAAALITKCESIQQPSGSVIGVKVFNSTIRINTKIEKVL